MTSSAETSGAPDEEAILLDVDDHEAWLRLARGRLLPAMRHVEALPPRAAGALVVGDRTSPAGMILVERNRICWTIAAGMSRRLRDILIGHALAIGEAELEALYARCRSEGRPLGEALVAEGAISAAQLRAAMKQHTIESLLALDAITRYDENADDAWPLTWVERGGRGYNPRYTFTAAEVLAAVGSRLLDEAVAELVTDHLQALDSTGGSAIAFLPDDEGGPLFVAAQTTLWLSVQDLLELAEWADAALAASPGFSPIVAHAWAQAASAGAVAWIFEGHVCAAVCPTRQSLQRLVATLDKRSLAMVLATRLTVLDRLRDRSHVPASPQEGE